MIFGERGRRMGSGMVPLDRALLSSFSNHSDIGNGFATIFAEKIMTKGSDPKSPLPVAKYSATWGHTSVSVKWHLIPSNGFSRVHECDRRTTRLDVCRSWQNR